MLQCLALRCYLVDGNVTRLECLHSNHNNIRLAECLAILAGNSGGPPRSREIVALELGQ